MSNETDLPVLLVIEDDEGLQRQLKWAYDGYKVVVAGDRPSAIEALRVHEPAVVTLDLGLPPDPDGTEEGFLTLQEMLALKPDTKILHTTKRRTQPWKTGLPVDYTLRERGPLDFIRRWKRRRYEQHPDPNQEALVYSLLAEMVDQGIVTRDEIVAEMAADHLRHDSLEVMERYRGWNGLAAA